MTWQHTPYTLPLLLAGGLVGSIGLYGATRRRERVDRTIVAFVALTGCAGAWAVATALQAASVELGAKLWFLRLQTVAGAAVALAWFAFATSFARDDGWLTRRRFALLAAPLIVTEGAGWANGGRGRMLTRASLDSGGSFVVLDWTPGPWFLLDSVYAHVLVVLGIGLLARMALTARGPYRRQARFMVAAAIVPAVASVAFLSRGDATVDLTPLAFAVSAVLFANAVFRHRFLDVVPVARDAVIEGLRDGFVVFDREGQVVDANRAARRLLGRRGLIGRSAEAVLDGWEGLLEGMDDGTAREERTIEVNGEGRRIEGRRSRIEDQRVDGQVLLLRDVTDRHRRERELRRANEGLESFASVVSHDLRNPLNVAQGYLNLAGEDVSPDRRAAIDRIDRAHQRMGLIIDDTLGLARSGGEIEGTEPVALDGAARRAWETAETRDATLSLVGRRDAGAGSPERMIEADRDRLERLLENLFRNGAEHGGSGTTVRVGRLEDGFFVADDGPGIPHDRREAVFQPGRTTDTDGTGLGLAIVKRIVDAHGADVHVAGSESGGARFEVTGFGTGEREPTAPAGNGRRTIDDGDRNPGIGTDRDATNGASERRGTGESA